MRPQEEKEQSQQQPVAEETAEIFHTAGNAAKTVEAYALKTAKNHLFHGAEKAEVICEVATGICKSVGAEDKTKVVVNTAMDVTLGIVGGAAGITVGSVAGPLGSAAGYSVGSYAAVKANHLLRDILEDTPFESDYTPLSIPDDQQYLDSLMQNIAPDMPRINNFRRTLDAALHQESPSNILLDKMQKMMAEPNNLSLLALEKLNTDLPEAMQSAAITLTPQQQESLSSLHQEIQVIAADIHQLQDNAKNNAQASATLQTNIDLKIARASQLITDCKRKFGVIHHDQDKLTQMMEVIFDASTKVDISRVSDMTHIRQLDSELKELKARHHNGELLIDAITQKSRELEHEATKELSKRVEFSDAIYSASQTVSSAAKLLFLFGDEETKKVAQDLATVGLSTLDAIEQGAALFGHGLLAASVNPAVAVVSIAEAVMNIKGLFNKPKSTPHPNEAVLKAIGKLFNLIDQMRQEMHQEFNALKEKIDAQTWLFLEKFYALQKTNSDILIVLNTLYHDVHDGFEKQEERLSHIANHLLTLDQQISATPYREDVEYLKEAIHFIIQNTLFTDYNDRINKIDFRARENGIHHQLKTVLDLQEGSTGVNYFQVSAYLALQLQSPLKQSPLLLLYGAVANLLLVMKKHPVPNAEYVSQRLTTKDFERLISYQRSFDQIAELIQNARNPEKLKQFIDAYQTAVTQLMHVIDGETKNFEVRFVSDKRRDREVASTHQRAQEWDRFNQEIKVHTGKWYTGNHMHESRSYPGYWVWTNTNKEYTDTAQLQAFVSSETEKRRRQRTDFRITYENRLTQSQTDQLSLFGASNLTPLHQGLFFSPLGSMHFLPLPIPDPLFTTHSTGTAVMRILKEAQTLGLGTLLFSYQLLAESDHYHQVTYSVQFAPNHAQPETILSIVLPFTYRPHGIVESVWNDYMGGLMRVNAEGIKQPPRRVGITGAQAMAGSGNGHRSGCFEADEYTLVTPPPEVDQPGKIKQFDNPTSLTVFEPALDRVKTKIEEGYHAFRTQYRKTLEKQLDLTQSDALGNAVKAFEQSYRLLEGVLTLAYFDDMQNPNSPIRKILFDHAINLKQLKSLSVETNLKERLQHISQILPDMFKKLSMLSTSDFNFKLFEDARASLNQLLPLYQPYLVDHSPDFPELDQSEKIIQLQTKIIVGIVSGILSEMPSLAANIERIVQDQLKDVPPLIAEEIALRANNELKLQHKALPFVVAVPQLMASNDDEKEALADECNPIFDELPKNEEQLCQAIFGEKPQRLQAQSLCTQATNVNPQSLFGRLCSWVAGSTHSQELSPSDSVHSRGLM